MTMPHIDPVAISIGSLQLRWYGLMYLIGFAVGWGLGRWRAQSAKSHLFFPNFSTRRPKP